MYVRVYTYSASKTEGKRITSLLPTRVPLALGGAINTRYRNEPGSIALQTKCSSIIFIPNTSLIREYGRTCYIFLFGFEKEKEGGHAASEGKHVARAYI